MEAFQIWLVSRLVTLGSVTGLSPDSVMRSRWGWPICESIHFLGLSLLIGTIAMFDLRLLGIAKRVPITALHRLVPWGILGFAMNGLTGLLFLLTEPDQYIYNPAFHFKMLFLALAGFNVLAFYLVVFRQLAPVGGGGDTPRSAKLVATVSLILWLGVIVGGRFLTFYRPFPCEGEHSFLSTCIP